MILLSFALFVVAAPCNSTMTCAPACEKDDAQACAWMAKNHKGIIYAARACALDEKACDMLAREILSSRPTDADVDEAVKRIAPACEKGDIDGCEAILDASTKYGEVTRPALVPFAKSAAQRYCAGKQPKACAPTDKYCSDGWSEILSRCTFASTSFAMPALAETALDRARADCKKNAGVCSEILDDMQTRVDKAPSVAEKQARNKELVEIAERVVDACKAPGDRACEMLGWGNRFDDSPTLAKKIAQKKCMVEGGSACSEQARRECNGGKGPLAACIDTVLAGGSRYDDDIEAIEKRVTEACIKDDKRACFAVGISKPGVSLYRFRTALIEADEAFARGCKLGHAPSCRASKRPAAIAKPGDPPKDALRPSETEAVLIRAKGDGAPLARRVLVEEWRWYVDARGADDEARADREVYELSELVALAGLREGADVVVWDERRNEIKRYVAVVNVAP